MSGHVYVPFEKDSELSQQALMFPRSNKKYRSEYYEPGELSDLSEVNANEVIYVFAHGKKNDDRMYGTLGQTLHPVTLAMRMVAQNLKKSHEKIKLWVCFSGEGAEECKGSAFKFWQAMDGYGYANLTVYGYRTQVSTIDPRTDEEAANAEGRVKLRDLDGVDRRTPLPKGQYKRATEGNVILQGKAKDYRVAISRSGISGPRPFSYISMSDEYYAILGKLPLPPPPPV